ncbi:transferase family-domain-containing protein [Aspergillus unguis]
MVDQTELLTPLDLLMPSIYIKVLFTFAIRDSQQAIAGLQRGLDKLAKAIPWIAGTVCQSQHNGKPALEIRYAGSPIPPELVDKGCIAASYNDLAARGMPMDVVPAEVWPVGGVDDADFAAAGAPVLAASVFRFGPQEQAGAGGGLGLCVCMHHNVVDAASFTAIVHLWAQSTAGMGPDIKCEPKYQRLLQCLATDIAEIQAEGLECLDLLARHPEYSANPPTLPEESVPCTSKVFTIRAHWLNVLREVLQKHTSTPPTTNALISALLWTCITRARARRNADLQSSRLVTAVNAARRIGLHTDDNPYLGNTILYALASLPASTLSGADMAPAAALAGICNSIAKSQSAMRISAQQAAEVHALVERVPDYRGIYPGWDLFNSRDLTVSSWAGLDLYAVDFGTAMGKPGFVRVPCVNADGVVIVLPRRRRRGVEDEVLEAMVMLRMDDMCALERDGMWEMLISTP